MHIHHAKRNHVIAREIDLRPQAISALRVTDELQALHRKHAELQRELQRNGLTLAQREAKQRKLEHCEGTIQLILAQCASNPKLMFRHRA